MIPTDPRGRGREDEVLSDTSNEQLGQDATSLCSDVGRSEGRNVVEDEDWGTAAERPPVAASEHTFDGDQHNEETQHTVQSKGSEGKCWCPGNFCTANVDQFQGRSGKT